MQSLEISATELVLQNILKIYSTLANVVNETIQTVYDTHSLTRRSDSLSQVPTPSYSYFGECPREHLGIASYGDFLQQRAF